MLEDAPEDARLVGEDAPDGRDEHRGRERDPALAGQPRRPQQVGDAVEGLEPDVHQPRAARDRPERAGGEEPAEREPDEVRGHPDGDGGERVALLVTVERVAEGNGRWPPERRDDEPGSRPVAGRRGHRVVDRGHHRHRRQGP
ncbi:MAG: hypothetical protein U5R31_06425 [Acidimicrobiia bacterium]|nr:hypothetical protein [Acidimicrobiia bacterium]